MSDWMDTFEMFGSKLNEGEKTLMRFAVSREQRRIIKLLEEKSFKTIHDEVGVSERLDVLIALIKGENK